MENQLFVKKDMKFYILIWCKMLIQIWKNGKLPFRCFLSFFYLRWNQKDKIIVLPIIGYHAFFPALIGKLANVPLLLLQQERIVIHFLKFIMVIFQKDTHFYKMFICFMHSYFTKTSDTLGIGLHLWQCTIYKKAKLNLSFPNLKDKFTVINGNGFEVQLLRQIQKIKKTFVTAARLLQFEYQRKLKGIDLILDVAPRIARLYFSYCWGKGKHTGIKSPSKNVVLHPPLSLSN